MRLQREMPRKDRMLRSLRSRRVRGLRRRVRLLLYLYLHLHLQLFKKRPWLLSPNLSPKRRALPTRIIVPLCQYPSLYPSPNHCRPVRTMDRVQDYRPRRLWTSTTPTLPPTRSQVLTTTTIPMGLSTSMICKVRRHIRLLSSTRLLLLGYLLLNRPRRPCNRICQFPPRRIPTRM